MQHSLDVLEFPLIKANLASFASTSLGKGRIESLSLLPLDDLKVELENLTFAWDAIYVHGHFPVSSSVDCSKPLAMAHRGYRLSGEDFRNLIVNIDNAVALKRYFASLEGDSPLRIRVENLQDLSSLAATIDSVVSSDGSVRDNASPELKRLRNNIARLERNISRLMEKCFNAAKPYLSGDSVSMKNGHFVLPVSSSYKHAVKGYVQSYSSSGGTIFIEPEEIVEVENEITESKLLEQEEVLRLLLELSQKVDAHYEELLFINDELGYFDFLQAKVLYGRSLHGSLASLSEDGSFYLPSAYHPLIPYEKAVKNDFSFTENKKIVVVSGPNAGGKTVALKTLGICAVLFLFACPLPCLEGAKVPYFKHVYVDIGDSQSLTDNLSTFSGHIANIGEILRYVGGKDLVLLDEVGTGTSPSEGEALAYAILRYLLKKHCYGFVSSHFEGLKAFALSSKGIENASLLFDEENFAPTYRFVLGVPGESYGLKVASTLHLPPEIITDASSYLAGEEELSLTKALNKLKALSDELIHKQTELAKQKKKLDAELAEVEAKRKELEEKEAHLLEDVGEKKEELIREARKQIDELLSSLPGGLTKKQANDAKRQLDELQNEDEHMDSLEELHEGDYVRLKDYNMVGRISRIKGRRVEVSASGMTMELDIADVSLTSPPKKKTEASTVVQFDFSAVPSSLELNIIGMHVDEAKTLIERYLSRCVASGYSRVRIIHGLGSGALRNLTAEICQSHKYKYERAGEGEGGLGATIVTLKK